MKEPELVYTLVNLNDALDKIVIPKSFQCGDKTLDDYVTSGNLKRAVKSENLHASAICNEHMELVGFMTMGFSLVDKSRVNTTKGNQPKQLAVAKVFMIGVDESHQGRGLGTDLMLEAFTKAVTVHTTIPLKAVYLDAAPGKASFYSEVFGFDELEEDGGYGTTPMYNPIENVIAALLEADDSD
ncbi:GNAT family N-acetyltransferase [Pseudomonas sp. SWRI51]|uniref:GNAT family N-acetyltransferase n=1 Tax=Pseudomonas sp. SWRI51 TaxID=2745491 RepID=UPI001644947F|nr:GNAT family N-acetyltransferase [Pseudomonas sp. SWRI51]MBC3410102.1 GNAT family N-acetyltransferase [Pseudomonas sp. SWRI51]